MSGAWPKVIPGQALRYPASLHNTLVDVARERRAPGAGRLADLGAADYFTRVLIRNTDEQACPARGAMRLTAATLDPSANLTQFLDRPVFDAAVAIEANSDAAAAIAVNKIEGGELGEAAIAGVIQARVNVTDADHRYAKPSETTAFGLDSASGSGFRMLWKESGTGTKWALLELPETAEAVSGVIPAIISSSTTTLQAWEFEYTLKRAETVTGESSDWTEGETLSPAYNTAERIGFTDFTEQPISDGVGVLAFEVDGVYYFTHAPIEGSCS